MSKIGETNPWIHFHFQLLIYFTNSKLRLRTKRNPPHPILVIPTWHLISTKHNSYKSTYYNNNMMIINYLLIILYKKKRKEGNSLFLSNVVFAPTKLQNHTKLQRWTKEVSPRMCSGCEWSSTHVLAGISSGKFTINVQYSSAIIFNCFNLRRHFQFSR